MLATKSNEWGLIIPSVADGTQPNALTARWGTAITPGTSNAYGSYTSVMSGATLTDDAFLIEVIISTAFVSASDRGMLVTIGFDPAGGTSFGGLGGVTGNEISDLLCSSAYYWFQYGAAGGGHRFRFPVFIKAGTSIGAKAQTNSATAGNVDVAVVAYCKPSHPELIRAGSFVRTFGANTTTTDGVSVTPGQASEGSWTEIGTAADDLWYLETGIGARSSAQADSAVHTDISIGDATNKRVIAPNLYTLVTSSEATCRSDGPAGAHAAIKSGDKIYARSQASTNLPVGFSIACYGVGG